MLQNKSNAAFGLVVSVTAAWLFYVTTGFDGESDDRLFPQIILAILVVLGVVLILAEIKIFKHTRRAVSSADRCSTRKILAFSVAIAYPLTAFVIGFFSTTLIFLLIVPWIFTRNEFSSDGTIAKGLKLANAAYAVLVSLFLYLSFAVLLKFALPPGLLI